MSKFHTNVLSISYKGKTYTVRYWADGNGRHAESYATSLSQLRHALRKNVAVGALDLYVVADRKMRPIASDRHLRQALKNVPNRGSLHVYAYDHKDIDLSAFLNTNKHRSLAPARPRYSNVLPVH